MPDTLPPDLQRFVDHELATGNYGSAGDMIADGLRLLRERKLYELRKDIDDAARQIEHGEGIEVADETSLAGFFEDNKARGRQHLEAQ